jgi:PAS domain S-box-containing protein
MLRRRLTFYAAGLALVLSFVLIGFELWAGTVVVSIMSDRLVQEVAQSVHRELGHFVRGTERAVTRVANNLSRQELMLGDSRAVGRQLYTLLTEEPGVDWLFFGNEAGGIVSVGRSADTSTVFLMSDEFRAGVVREFEALPSGGIGRLRKSERAVDFRQKIWYVEAKGTGNRYWTEPYLGAVEPVLGVSLSAPIFNKDGNFVGVCGADLILTDLSRFLQTLEIGDHGRAFIIDATGRLIAASGGVSPVTTSPDSKEHRLLASETTDPIVRETARYLGQHPDISGSSSRGPRVFSFDDTVRGRIYAAVDHAEEPGPLNWTVVSAVPASDFLGPVYHAAYLSFVIGTVIVAVFVVLGGWAVRRTLQPLTALTQAAQAIARGEWRDVPEVERIDEVGLLAQAFARMSVRLKETLDGLRMSEAKLEEAQRVAHVGYWEHDLDSDRLAWSDETYRICGLTPGEGPITRTVVMERMHPEDRPSWNQAVTAALCSGSHYEVEYRVVRPDGELRIVHNQGDLIRDASGRPRAMFGTIQDITERKRAEEVLREVQMELAHANRLATMWQLTASIAHEVNQPVAAAATNAEAGLRWLDANPPDLEEARNAFDRIVKDGRRASGIIARIRDLLKKTSPREDRLEMNEAIREVVELTRGEAMKNGVSVRTELAEGLSLVHGDRIQLQQAILNLIINAIEAMCNVSEGARELLISTGKAESGGVLVAVRDTGPGMGAASPERMFEAFYTTKPGGLGMGLAICRSTIEAHGGRLWASANEPRGTVFQFTLPAGTRRMRN